jgi:predicted CoA-binding protein
VSATDTGVTDEQMRELLERVATIAVVGLSSDMTRPSYSVARYMQAMGYRIIPVNPNCTQVLGEKSYPSLRDVPTEHHIDLVNVFRRSSALPGVIDDVIALGAPVVWLQLGVTHADAEARARAAGLLVISGQCIKVEHARLVDMRRI